MSVEFFDGVHSTTLTGIAEHQIRVRLLVRKKEPLSKLNVACVNWLGWRRRYQRAPADVVEIREVFDNTDSGHVTYRPGDGSAIVHHHPPVLKGKRPSGLTIILAPRQAWSGWLSLRDDTTSQTARLRLRIVEEAQDARAE
jgi:hypothetical protein